MASPDIGDIENLIEKYGKQPIITFILESRNNRITVTNKKGLQDFSGAPDPKYVTPETILTDFEQIGVSPIQFEEMENRKRLHKVEANDMEAGEGEIRSSELMPTEIALYVATYSPVTLRSGPNFSSPEIGEIPKGMIVEALETELEWIRAEIEGKGGWAPIALAWEEKEDVGPPKIYCSLYGTRYVGHGVFRSYIKVLNAGTAEFSGSLTIYGYHGDQIVFYGFQHFELEPIRAGEGKTIYLETMERITEIESKCGKAGHVTSGNP
jgi:hypothetical protein